MRAGAGYVRLGVPGAVARVDPVGEAVGLPLPADGWADAVLAAAARCRALVDRSRPRAGARPSATGVRRVLGRRRAVPAVVDADGLNALGTAADAAPASPASRSHPTVITPHEGEFARLFGAPPGPDRLAAVRRAAADTGAVVLLKGSTTVVAAPDGRVLLAAAGIAPAGHGRHRRRALGGHRRLPRPGRARLRRGRPGRPRPRPGRRARPGRGPGGRRPARPGGPLAVASRDDRDGSAGAGPRPAALGRRRHRCARPGPRSTWPPSGTTPGSWPSLVAPAAALRGGQGVGLRPRAGPGGPGRARGRRHLAGRGPGRGGPPAAGGRDHRAGPAALRAGRAGHGRGGRARRSPRPSTPTEGVDALAAAVGGQRPRRSAVPGARQGRHRHAPGRRRRPTRRSQSRSTWRPGPSCELEGLWTHFAVADEPASPYTAEQLARFREVVERLAAVGRPAADAARRQLGRRPVPPGRPPRHGPLRRRPVRPGPGRRAGRPRRRATGSSRPCRCGPGCRSSRRSTPASGSPTACATSVPVPIGRGHRAARLRRRRDPAAVGDRAARC